MKKKHVSSGAIMRRGIRNIVSMALVVSLTLGFCGCNKASKPQNTQESISTKSYPKLESQTVDAGTLSFKDYAKMIFDEDILTGTGTYIQLVQKPEDFGLQGKELTTTRMTKEDYQHTIDVAKDRLAVVNKFDTNKLDQNEKIEYELLKNDLERQIQTENCYYYYEPLSPLNGAQVSLSSNLSLYAERVFETMEANNELKPEGLDNYFKLCEEYGQYLQDVAVFEKEKIELGMGMSKNHAQEVIAQIDKILDSDAVDFSSEIITQIQKADFFTQEEKATLSDKAQNMVKEQIIPGFKDVKKELEKITDKTKCFTNYSTTEDGKKYYLALLEKSTSTKDTPEQLQTELVDSFKSIYQEFIGIYQANPGILSVASEACPGYTNTEDLIHTLIQKGKEDLPDVDYNFTTRTMPQELNGVYGGLYFPPAIDSTVEQKYMYLGSLYKEGTPQYIQMITHEGALGHLYQHEYFADKDLSPLYYNLYYGMTGYLEGWTTYIEQFGYKYAGYSEDEARFLQINRLMDLYLASYVDISANYLGWDEDKVIKEVKELLPLDDNTIKSVIDQVQKAPTLFLSYSVGDIKMLQLKEALDKKYNKTLTSKEFHELYFSIPPATFDILFRELGV